MNGAPVPINGDLLSDVMAAKGLIGVPPEIAADALRKAAIDFATQTGIWEYEGSFETQYNVADYPIYTPEGSRLASMKSVSVDGSGLNGGGTWNNPNVWNHCGCGYSFRMQGRDTLWINPVPNDPSCHKLVRWSGSLKPMQNACELPEILVEDWNDALIAGAAFRLFSIPKQEWSNNGLAMMNHKLYTREIARARLTKMQNYSQRGVQMTGSYF